MTAPAAWRQITRATDWQGALAALPAPHALQTWAWGEFKSHWGWTAQRWLLSDASGAPQCAVQLLRRAAGPSCVLYAPKGPAAHDAQGYSAGLSHIESLARAARALWAKVDGDPPFGPDGWSDADLQATRAALTTRGWQPAPAQIQFRNTAFTDLRLDDDALLAAMAPKCRYNVRLAERRGVTVRIAQPVTPGPDADTLYALYAATGARDGFAIRTQAYYQDAWARMGATALLAEREGRLLSALVLFTTDRRAWYFYGMSGTEGREHMPNHLLQWRAQQWARAQGCVSYDWWGAPETPAATDRLSGVWRFKEAFGARFAEGVGAWDFAPGQALYQLATRALPRIKAIIRGKSKQEEVT